MARTAAVSEAGPVGALSAHLRRSRSPPADPLQAGGPLRPVNRLGAGHMLGRATQGRWRGPRGQTIGSTHVDRGSEVQARPALWEPCADQFPDRSRQRAGRSSRRLVERDRLFERRYALFLRVVFRRESCEHGFDAGLPTAEGGSGEDVGRGRVSGAAIDKAPAGPPPDRRRRAARRGSGIRGRSPVGQAPGRRRGQGPASVPGKPPIAVIAEAGSGARAGLPAIGGASFGAVGQVPALRRARRAR
jgi:hypothetical protein